MIGDYDVDGATSTALLARYLRALGVAVEIVIPDRMQRRLRPQRPACSTSWPARLPAGGDAGHRHHGVRAAGACGRARARGDRGRPPCRRGAAARRPWPWSTRTGSTRRARSSIWRRSASPSSCWSAVTRVLRAQGAFAARPEPPLLSWLDLVASARSATWSRSPASTAPSSIRASRSRAPPACPAWRRWPQAAGLAAVTDARQFGFALGPRINAGGRIGRSDLGARLLTTDPAAEAAEPRGPAARAQRASARRSSAACSKRRSARSSRSSRRAAGADGRRRRLASGRRRHRRQPAGRAPPSPGGRAGRRRRHRQGLGPLDPRLRSRCGGDRGPPAGPAAAGRRPRHGRRDDAGRGRTSQRFHRFLLDRLAAETGARRAAARAAASSTARSASAPPSRPWRSRSSRWRPTAPATPSPLRPDRRAGGAGPHRRRRPCQLHADRRRRRPGQGDRLSQRRRPPLGRELLESRLPLHLAGRVKLDTWQGREQASFEIEDAAPVG